MRQVPITSLRVAAITLVGVFSALAIFVGTESHISGFERIVDHAMLSDHPSRAFDIARIVTTAGSGSVVGVAAILLGVVVWMRTHAWRLAVLCVAAPAIAGMTEIVVKTVIGRNRPATAALTGESGFGFPSGHTAGSTALATALIIAVSLVVHDGRGRTLVTGVAVLYAVVIGISRLVLGAHHAADVVGGWLLGAAITLGIASILLVPSGPSTLDEGGPGPSSTIEERDEPVAVRRDEPQIM